MKDLRKLEKDLEALKIKRGKLDKEIKAMERKRDKMENAILRDVVKKPENWIYSAYLKKKDIWDKGVVEGLYVEMRMKPSIVRKLKEAGITTDFAQGQGMFYYRTGENILVQGGGGYRILKTPKICSDENWNRISKGDIPKEFLRED